jgi:serine/threonine-protein kinase
MASIQSVDAVNISALFTFPSLAFSPRWSIEKKSMIVQVLGGQSMFRITTAITALMLLCASAQAATTYGAIAFSPDTGAAGYSTGRGTRANAEDWAMYYCDQYAYDCRVAVHFRNACGAVARGQNGGWGSSWDYDRAGAQNNAIASCRRNDSGCRIIRWACSK